jgi:hypothetical protein
MLIGQSWHGRQAGWNPEQSRSAWGRNPPFVPICVSMALHPLVGGTLPDGECGRVGHRLLQTALIVRCPDWVLTVRAGRVVPRKVLRWRRIASSWRGRKSVSWRR